MARVAPPRDKITAADFKKLRKKEKEKMMYGTAMAKGMKEGGKKKAKKKNYGAEKAAVRTGKGMNIVNGKYATNG